MPVARCNMLRHRMLVWVVILALLGGAGWYGIDWFRNPAAAPVEYPASPTHQSPDGAGKLTVPDRVTEGNPKVTFLQNPTETAKAARSIKNNPKLAFRPVGSTMDIVVSGGSFRSDKVAVTLKYNPKQIPKGLTAQQVGMAVYDQRLNSWVPLLGAKADPETNTVTALAPHFSWFSAIVLDPAKKVVEMAGKQIKTTIDSTVTIGSWTINLVNALANNLIDDLFVRVDDAKCSPVSKQLSVQTVSDFNRLQGCVEQQNKYGKLKLTNRFAFPMRSNKLPTGITLGAGDILNNGENLPELLQAWFWASNKQLYVSGASRAEATITPEMGQQEKVGLELDSESIAANIGLSVLMVFSPDKGTAKGALKKVIEKSLAKNKVVRGETGEPEAWVNQTYDLLDCIVNTEHDSIDQPLKREGFEAAADLAHGCLGGVLDTLDLQGALAEVLSSLKSIPAVIEGMVYSTGGALLDTLPEAFDQIKQKQPSITVVREGNTTPAKPKPKPKPSKKPQAQPSNKGNLGALVGEWKAGSGLGLTTLYLKSSGPSTYKHFGPCSTDPDSTKFTWCTVTGTLTLTAYDAKYVDARWGEPTARDRSGNRITLIPEVVDRFSGTSVISLAPDGRAIAVDNGLYSGIEFCSPQMYTMSRDTNSTHWSRCNGVPK